MSNAHLCEQHHRNQCTSIVGPLAPSGLIIYHGATDDVATTMYCIRFIYFSSALLSLSLPAHLQVTVVSCQDSNRLWYETALDNCGSEHINDVHIVH
jgi:hypothetical protein